MTLRLLPAIHSVQVASERYESIYAGFRDTRENKLLKVQSCLECELGFLLTSWRFVPGSCQRRRGEPRGEADCRAFVVSCPSSAIVALSGCIVHR